MEKFGVQVGHTYSMNPAPVPAGTTAVPYEPKHTVPKNTVTLSADYHFVDFDGVPAQ